jgi:hypothetical protein
MFSKAYGNRAAKPKDHENSYKGFIMKVKLWCFVCSHVMCFKVPAGATLNKVRNVVESLEH